MIVMDKYVEELAQSKNDQTEAKKQEEEKKEETDFEGLENFPQVFVSPIENLMDKFKGSVKDFWGLFKVPKANVLSGNLHQQICNTAKEQFESTNSECNLYGLDFLLDGQTDGVIGFQEPMAN